MRIVITVWIAAMLFSYSISSSAVSVSSEIITGNFRYLPVAGNSSVTGTYFYSDSYFAHSGKEKDPHLRTMSLDIALAAFGTYENDNSEYIVSLLKDIGFEDIQTYHMDITPTPDTLGTVIAHKKTLYGDVIAVAVRGGKYGKEWVNSLSAGETGDAVGFSRAAGLLISRIKNYKTDHGLINSRIWMTGYSRGGAVTDLAGKYINNDLSSFGITDDDLYIYTFEAPAASETASGFKNIHNVVHPYDIVPMVYPESWGFYHSGTTEMIECEKQNISYKQLSFSDGLNIADKYDISYDPLSSASGSSESVSQDMATIEREVFMRLSHLISRRDYVAVSPYLCGLISLYNDKGSSLIPIIEDAVSSLDKTNPLMAYHTAQIIYGDIQSNQYEKSIGYMTEKIISAFEETNCKDILTDEEFDEFKNNMRNIMKFLFPVITKDYKEYELETLSTLIGNLDVMIRFHFEENVLAALEKTDTYHNPYSLNGAEITIDETTADVVCVKLDNNTLRAGLDYTVSYKDKNNNLTEPEESGIYTAVIEGVGNYSGRIEQRFEAVFPHFHKFEFSSEGDGIISVKCVNKGCTDYTTGREYILRAETKSKIYDGIPMSVKVMKDNGFPSEIVLEEPEFYDDNGKLSGPPSMPGRYTISVKVYYSEDNNVSAEAKTDFEISRLEFRPGSINIELEENSAEVLSVTYNGKTLVRGTDYGIYYMNEDGEWVDKPAAPGKYTLVAEGIGLYTGSTRKELVIEISPVWIIITAASAAVLISAAVIVLMKLKKRNKNTGSV